MEQKAILTLLTAGVFLNTVLLFGIYVSTGKIRELFEKIKGMI